MKSATRASAPSSSMSNAESLVASTSAIVLFFPQTKEILKKNNRQICAEHNLGFPLRVKR